VGARRREREEIARWHATNVEVVNCHGRQPQRQRPQFVCLVSVFWFIIIITNIIIIIIICNSHSPTVLCFLFSVHGSQFLHQNELHSHTLATKCVMFISEVAYTNGKKQELFLKIKKMLL